MMNLIFLTMKYQYAQKNDFPHFFINNNKIHAKMRRSHFKQCRIITHRAKVIG